MKYRAAFGAACNHRSRSAGRQQLQSRRIDTAHAVGLHIVGQHIGIDGQPRRRSSRPRRPPGSVDHRRGSRGGVGDSVFPPRGNRCKKRFHRVRIGSGILGDDHGIAVELQAVVGHQGRGDVIFRHTKPYQVQIGRKREPGDESTLPRPASARGSETNRLDLDLANIDIVGLGEGRNCAHAPSGAARQGLILQDRQAAGCRATCARPPRTAACHKPSSPPSRAPGFCQET